MKCTKIRGPKPMEKTWKWWLLLQFSGSSLHHSLTEQMLGISAPYFLSNCLFCLGFKFSQLYPPFWEPGQRLTIPRQEHKASPFPAPGPQCIPAAYHTLFFPESLRDDGFPASRFPAGPELPEETEANNELRKRTQCIPTTASKYFPPSNSRTKQGLGC